MVSDADGYRWTSGVYDRNTNVDNQFYVMTEYTDTVALTSQWWLDYDDEYIYVAYRERGHADTGQMVAWIDLNPNPSVTAQLSLYFVFNWSELAQNTTKTVFNEFYVFEYTADDTRTEPTVSDYVEEKAGSWVDDGMRALCTVEFKIKRSALAAYSEIDSFDTIGFRGFTQSYGKSTADDGSAEAFYADMDSTSKVFGAHKDKGYHIIDLPRPEAPEVPEEPEDPVEPEEPEVPIISNVTVDGMVSDADGYRWTSGSYNRNTDVPNQFYADTKHTDTVALTSQWWLDYDDEYIYVAYRERGHADTGRTVGWIDLNPDPNETAQLSLYYVFTADNVEQNTTKTTFSEFSVFEYTADDTKTTATESDYVEEKAGSWYDDTERKVFTVEFKIKRSALAAYSGIDSFETIGFRGVTQSTNGEAFYADEDSTSKVFGLHKNKGYHVIDLPRPVPSAVKVDGFVDSGEYIWTSGLYDRNTTVPNEFYAVAEHNDSLTLTSQWWLDYDNEYIYVVYRERGHAETGQTVAWIDLNPGAAAKGQVSLYFTFNKSTCDANETGTTFNEFNVYTYSQDGTQNQVNAPDYVVEKAGSWYDDTMRNVFTVEFKIRRSVLAAYADIDSFDTIGFRGFTQSYNGEAFYANESSESKALGSHPNKGYHIIDLSCDEWHSISETHHIMKEGETYTNVYGFHNWGNENILEAATETQDGRVEYTCLGCGAVDEDVIPATGHSLIRVDAKAATCTEDGYTQYKKCENLGCEYTYKPADYTTIPATGHAYDDAQDTDCNLCGEVREILCPHTNTTTKEENRINPSCTRPGSYSTVVTCTDCGKVTRTPYQIDKLDHVPVAIPAVEATCSTTGLTEGTKCGVCNQVIDAQKIEEKVAHTYDTAKDVGDGEHKFTCTVCSVTRTEKHDFAIIDDQNKCKWCDATPESIFDLGAVGQKHEYVGSATTDAPVLTGNTFELSKYTELAKLQPGDMEEGTKSDYFFWSEGMQIGHFKIYITYDASKIYLAAEVDSTYSHSDTMTFNITTAQGMTSFTLSGEGGDANNNVFVGSKIFTRNGDLGTVYAVEISRAELATVNTMSTGSGVDNQIAVSAEFTNQNGTATFGAKATDDVTSGGNTLVTEGAIMGMALTLASEDDAGGIFNNYGDSASIGISGVTNVIPASAVISVTLNWYTPTFSYNAAYRWNSVTHENELVEAESSWVANHAYIEVVNNSNQSISATFSFATTNALNNSGITGRFTEEKAVDTDSDGDIDMFDARQTAGLVNNRIVLDSAAPENGQAYGESKSKKVYFYVIDGVLPLAYTEGASIGNITITISSAGN